MGFILAKLAEELLRPSTLMVLPSLAGLVLVLHGSLRVGQQLLFVSLGCYVLVLFIPLDSWALLPLEDRFARPPEPAHIDGIIVLSGAIAAELSSDRGILILNAAADRITEAVALARRHPHARIVFTGASGDLLSGSASEATWASQLLPALGVDADRLVIEGSSRNTQENARNSQRIVGPVTGQRWLLITSASHMPRAVGVFRRLGWSVVPWPVAYRSGHSLRAWLEPALPERLANLDTAAHEWGGLLAYWLLDRTSALFPLPD